MARLIFHISKPLHKYFGLLCLIYFLIMGASGILLNHPEFIKAFSLPISWMPESYEYDNWNRMAFRTAVFSEESPGTLYVAGKSGVWESVDGGESFSLLQRGLPDAAWDRDTRALVLLENGKKKLFAGMRSGLYHYDFSRKSWFKTASSIAGDMDIVALVKADDALLVFTPHAGYRLNLGDEKPRLSLLLLKTNVPDADTIPLVRFFLKVHDGSVLGLPGKIFMDIMALALIFLSFSAIYIWYVPWRTKRRRRRRGQPLFFWLLHRYHLKIGIYSAFFLVLFALTGMFVRPPLFMAVAGHVVPSSFFPIDPDNGRWKREISKVVLTPEDNRLLMATGDGFFSAPADFSKPFEPLHLQVPVHDMGVTVLSPLSGQRLLVGSFSGLYVYDTANGMATDIKGKPVKKNAECRPMAGMVAGAAVHKGELQYWADYRTGLHSVEPDKKDFCMPTAIAEESRISLWHFLFEVHNGRIFRDWLGNYTWLIVPLGGLILLICVLSGTYDWFYRKA
jgi:hypothetical protein